MTKELDNNFTIVRLYNPMRLLLRVVRISDIIAIMRFTSKSKSERDIRVCIILNICRFGSGTGSKTSVSISPSKTLVQKSILCIKSSKSWYFLKFIKLKTAKQKMRMKINSMNFAIFFTILTTVISRGPIWRSCSRNVISRTKNTVIIIAGKRKG